MVCFVSVSYDTSACVTSKRRIGAVRSNPYRGVSGPVAEVAGRLLSSAGPGTYLKSHEARLARTLDVLCDMRPSGRVLELGTSEVIALGLKELFPAVTIDVTVFDESDSKDEIGEKTVMLSLGGRSLEAHAFVVDLEREPLPVADETYDVVICCEVVEHMETDPMYMLAEVNRVLKPNGRLLLTTPNAVSSRGIAKVVREVEPYFFMQYNKNGNYHRHNYEYSVLTLTTVLVAAGFSGKVWTEDLFEDPLHDDVDKLRTLGYELKNVGDNIIAVATKIGEVVNRYPECIYA